MEYGKPFITKNDKKNDKKINKRYVDIFNTGLKFRIIYADPPWSYNDKLQMKKSGKPRGIEPHYPTMTIKEICDLPIKNIIKKNSVLLLWTTAPCMPNGLKVIDSWGFKYKTQFIWHKGNQGMGHYSHIVHELLLIAVRGKCCIDVKKFDKSVQLIPRAKKHSEKPVWFRNWIDKHYLEGNRIELFARKNQNPCWYVWGNEVEF